MLHSIIPPSSANIWGAPGGCTGWVTMNQRYPKTEESPESSEGTASHWVASTVLQGNVKNCESLIGHIAPNAVVITDDMAEGADKYVNDVLSISHGNKIYVEQRIKIFEIHELSFGTCDCYFFDFKNSELIIWDYKYGFEVIEAFENWQLINYVAGIFKDQIDTVRMRIVQPRGYHRDGPIREWKIKSSDLHSYFDQLRINAAIALSNDATFNSGNHCKHCPGRHACDAALKSGIQLYEAASQPMPLELSETAIGLQLLIITRAIKQLDSLKTGYTAQVDGLIRRGINVPGWIAEPTYGYKAWDKSYDEIINMGKIFKKDLSQKKAITPKQAIKLGVDEAVINAYSSKKRTGIKIVQDDLNKVRSIFSQ